MLDCGIKNRINDFIARNGDFILIPDSCTILHETGATRDNNPYGYLKEPPENLHERARLQLMFCEMKLELAIEEFDFHKKQILAVTSHNLKGKFCPVPTEAQRQALEKLKMLKQKVAEWRKKEGAAKVNLENAKPQKLIDKEQASEANRKENEELLEKLQRIEI